MVTSQKVGEYGVFFAGEAGKKTPHPPLPKKQTLERQMEWKVPNVNRV